MSKILIFIVCAAIVYALIRNQMKARSEDKGKEKVDTSNMVKDPICGTYVEEYSDYKVKYYDKIYCFCSSKCLEEFKEMKIAEAKKSEVGDKEEN